MSTDQFQNKYHVPSARAQWHGYDGGAYLPTGDFCCTSATQMNLIAFGLWQTRFHDRIVRDQNELNRIAEYIENNVANWHLDELNKTNNL